MNIKNLCIYSKESDSGVKFDSFGFDWNLQIPILLIRDKGFIVFDEFKSVNPF